MKISSMVRVSTFGTKFLVIFLFFIFIETTVKSGSIHASTNDADTIPDFNFAAVGDWGCTEDAEDTLDNIIENNPEFVLGLGDYSYTTTADCWLDIIEPINDKMKIAIGNHEHIIYDRAYGNDSYRSPSLLNEYMRHFSLTKQYYSFNYQNVHFLVMSTEVPFSKDSEQYDFVKKDLEESSTNSTIGWIVTYFHNPIYSSPNQHLPNTSFRDTYHPLFDTYGVDLVLQGHNHNYQRSYPLKYNPSDSAHPLVATKQKTNYAELSPIFVIAGTGGESLYDLDDRSSFNVYQTERTYGFLNIDISDDGLIMKVTFYSNDDENDDDNGTIKDEFTIIKAS